MGNLASAGKSLAGRELLNWPIPVTLTGGTDCKTELVQEHGKYFLPHLRTVKPLHTFF